MTIPKIIFIVPYRDRENEKQFFTVYMNYILEDIDKNDYEIYFSHQKDSRPFNRGATKNIGFLAMKDKYPNDYKNISFVFNDVDTMPFFKNTFNYQTKPGTIKHYYGYTFALGGLFSITGQDFEICNGFPNYWGWGLEDNAIYSRARENNLVIDRSNFFDFKNREFIIHLKNEGSLRNISNDATKQYNKRLPYGLNSIKNLQYLINKNMIDITNFTTESDYRRGIYYNQDNRKTKGKIKMDINSKNYNNVDNRFKLNNLF